MLGRYGRSVLDSLCLLEVRIICQRSYQRLQTRKTCFFFLRMVSCRKTEYPGVAQLVAHVIWVDRRLIHSPESEIPEVLGTVACGGNSPVEKLPKNRAWPQRCPQTRKTCFFFLSMVSCRKIEYPGLAQLVARVVWDHQAGSSSLPSRTKTLWNCLISEGFSYLDGEITGSAGGGAP